MTHTPDQSHLRHAGTGPRPTRLHRPASILTGAIAAGALALAGFATTAPSATPDTERLQSSLSQAGPAVGEAVLAGLGDAMDEQRRLAGSVRIERLSQAHEAVEDSASAGRSATERVAERSAQIAAARKAERQAAEQAAAERAAAERAAAEEAAAEQAAAERAAAERAATEQAAAERDSQQQEAASRSSARPSAPAPAPAPAPVPSGDARSIARGMLASYGWGDDQFACLESLWQRESGWSHTATNPSSGAYGIPQSLPASKMASAGGDWRTNPATQIRWGLGYVQASYGSPCAAWSHSEAVGWY